MKDIIPAKKQSPILGLTGMGGGVGSNLGGSLAEESKYIDEVFSTYVYEGNNGAQSGLGPGVDLTKGGLAWVKRRNNAESHYLFDSERVIGGVYQSLATNTVNTQDPRAWNIAFNNNGLAFNHNDGGINASGSTYVNWQFRKAKGFFDVVTYTGNGTAGRTISHDLGSVPGCIMVKQTSAAANWTVYHRDLGNTNALYITDAAKYNDNAWWNSTTPTDSVFTLGNSDNTNKNGEDYVAYVFAGGASTAATARSVDFDGGEGLDLAATSGANIGTQTFCVECWVYLDDAPGSGSPSYARIFQLDGPTGNSAGENLQITIDPSAKRLYVQSGSSSIIGGDQRIKGGWHHIAVVRESNNLITSYIDGVLDGTVSSNVNFDPNSSNPRIRLGYYDSVGSSNGVFNGKISNFRLTIGEPVYTSTFIPSKEPLTTSSQVTSSSNVKLLCCNSSTVTGSTVTPSTISSAGSPTASTFVPFDDLEGYKYGENTDKGIIKCGSYKGYSSHDFEVNLGWEPQWIMIKRTDGAANWTMFDCIRGIVTGGNENYLYPNLQSTEYAAERISATATGFIVDSSAGALVNQNGGDYVFTAIRRPDGYVGKPVEAGTDAFAMDAGAGSTTMPNYDSGFPVDWSIVKSPTQSTDWENGGRLIQGKWLATNSTGAESPAAYFDYISNIGWMSGASAYNSNYQSWMWKRGQGFDMVAFQGTATDPGPDYAHSLGQVPELKVLKRRNATSDWMTTGTVLSQAIDGNNNSKDYFIKINTSDSGTTSSNYWTGGNDTSTHFTVRHGNSNLGGADNPYLCLLFASVDGISKVGHYGGNGSTNLTITTGFQPRFILIKRADGAGAWHVFDSVRGMGATDKLLQLNSNAAQLDVNYVTVSSTGWNTEGTSLTNGKYIYYAHA